MNPFTLPPRRPAATDRSRAAAWIVRLDGGEVRDADRQQLLAWLSEPGNASEYAAQRQLVDWARELPADHKADLLQSLRTHRRHHRTTTACLKVLSMSMLAAAALACVAWLLRPGLLSRSYVSDVGEMRTVGLPDGSTTRLNTHTTLRWVGSLDGRRVQLLSGEALFTIRPDGGHPFQIELKASRITVLGTRFDVYEKPNNDVVVTVLHGTVVVQGDSPGGPWREQLSANQEIQYSASGRRTVRVVDATVAADWSEGVFRSEGIPLERVVSELGRYTRSPIIIADPSLRALTVGGVFDVHDVPAALARLAAAADVPISVTRAGDAYVLRRAGPAPGARRAAVYTPGRPDALPQSRGS